jgi:cholesterol oxidase
MDGAALPSATGVNPSSTIAAVAERNVEHYIRRTLAQPAWVAPERKKAVPILDPLGALDAPASRPPSTPTVGVRFTETMRGHFMPGVVPGPGFSRAEFEAAERDGRAAGHKLEFTLTITMPNLRDEHDPMLHAGVARGRVLASTLAPPAGAEVKDGVFQLFIDPNRARARANPGIERRMLYALPFLGADGRPYLLDGVKVVRDEDDRHFELWTTTTTLYTVIREGHSATGRVVGTGIIYIRLPDFLRQLTTMRVIGTGGLGARVDGVKTFARLFLGGLWDVFFAPAVRPAATREA